MNNATATPIQTPNTAIPFGFEMPPLQGDILLVEDESFVLDVTAEILEAAGYHVLKARTAAEAVRVFQQENRMQKFRAKTIRTKSRPLPNRSNRSNLILRSPALKMTP